MEKDTFVYSLSIEEYQNFSGGSRLSYILGYILSFIDNNVEGKDETKYGGQYLESLGSHSSIM